MAFATGVIDGRIRFKQVRRSPILKRKLVLATLLLVFSVGHWRSCSGSEAARAAPDVPVIILAALGFFCSFGLGLLGNKVADSEMPGD